MAVDLLIALDEDVFADYAAEARRREITLEELLRRAIVAGAGQVYEPLTARDILSNDRPHLMLNLSRPE